LARIEVPPGEGSETSRMWDLVPEQGAAYRAFAEVMYSRTVIPAREREIARMCIALINDCQVCRRFRVPGLERRGVDEEMYAAVADWRHAEGFTVRERLAAEYAERFALDHLALDDDFWTRLRGAYTDAEVVDLTMMIGSWLAFGRMTAVLQLDDERAGAPA
jgi:AhpD family alkylhydroperoxidase